MAWRRTLTPYLTCTPSDYNVLNSEENPVCDASGDPVMAIDSMDMGAEASMNQSEESGGSGRE